MENQDLPEEILEKLKNLEIELQDGDITLKGFEKKKATLLAEVSQSSTPTQGSETEILEELGPEPSAADVVDFLDFLPSPTHSPTRTAEAVNHMEENHRQMQQQLQQQQQQPYQPLQQPMRPIQQQQQQYRPYPTGMAHGNPPMNAPYMGTSIPQHNRPYMIPSRAGYPQQPQPQIRPMQPSPNANTYYGQRPPPNMVYRPQPQPPLPQQQQMYQSRPHPNAQQSIPTQMQTSPGKMYRPRPNNGMVYRPQQQQQQQQQQYGNYQYNSNSSGMGNVNRPYPTGYYK